MRKYNTKTQAAVKAAITEAGRPLSVAELMQAKGLQRPTLKALLLRMLNEGSVKEIHGVGIPPCYALPDGAYGPLLYQAGESLYWKAPDGFRASYTVEITVGEVAKDG